MVRDRTELSSNAAWCSRNDFQGKKVLKWFLLRRAALELNSVRSRTISTLPRKNYFCCAFLRWSLTQLSQVPVVRSFVSSALRLELLCIIDFYRVWVGIFVYIKWKKDLNFFLLFSLPKIICSKSLLFYFHVKYWFIIRYWESYVDEKMLNLEIFIVLSPRFPYL